MRQVLIPAAGMGTRLGYITTDRPKCMIKVNGETLIARCLRQLDTLGFDRILIVTGHSAEKLESHVKSLGISTPIYFINNPDYKVTNNIVSVAMALNDFDVFDTLLIESDLIFEKQMLEEFLEATTSRVLIAPYKSYMDGTVVEIKNNKIYFSNLPENKKDVKFFKTVNIYYFTKDFLEDIFIPLLKIFLKQNLNNLYYETPLKLISDINIRSLGYHITHKKWFEIDDINDLDIASNLFSKDPLGDTQLRFGGFWRFEKMRDFTYLSNPYFPNEQFLSEMSEHLKTLVHHYPSSHAINAKLMSAILNIDQNLIMVGNGGSELISIFADHFPCQTILAPTFKEYQNRCKYPKLAQSLNDLSKGNHDCVIIVNPNNPNGNIYQKEALISLILKMPQTFFLIDESFMDFAETSQTLLNEDFLKSNKNVFILKSIGKSHGVGGLRLGALVGAEVDKFKKDLPIWNINSIAEFFMQRFKKYEKSFHTSIASIRTERINMERRLSEILNVTINQSHGNFAYFELEKQHSKELQKHLFDEGFIIKIIEIDENKSGIRLAIRNQLDNHLLLAALERFKERC